MVDTLITKNSAVHSSNIGTHPLERMDSPQRKNYFGHPVQDTLPAHHRSFAPEWQQTSQEAQQQTNITLQSSANFYNTHAHPLPDIHVGSHVSIQNQRSKLWDNYGVITEISPHRRYYIKTQEGRVLVHNRRFLRRHVPASIPANTQQTEVTHHDLSQDPPPR